MGSIAAPTTSTPTDSPLVTAEAQSPSLIWLTVSHTVWTAVPFDRLYPASPTVSPVMLSNWPVAAPSTRDAGLPAPASTAIPPIALTGLSSTSYSLRASVPESTSGLSDDGSSPTRGDDIGSHLLRRFGRVRHGRRLGIRLRVRLGRRLRHRCGRHAAVRWLRRRHRGGLRCRVRLGRGH